MHDAEMYCQQRKGWLFRTPQLAAYFKHMLQSTIDRLTPYRSKWFKDYIGISVLNRENISLQILPIPLFNVFEAAGESSGDDTPEALAADKPCVVCGPECGYPDQDPNLVEVIQKNALLNQVFSRTAPMATITTDLMSPCSVEVPRSMPVVPTKQGAVDVTISTYWPERASWESRHLVQKELVQSLRLKVAAHREKTARKRRYYRSISKKHARLLLKLDTLGSPDRKEFDCLEQLLPSAKNELDAHTEGEIRMREVCFRETRHLNETVATGRAAGFLPPLRKRRPRKR